MLYSSDDDQLIRAGYYSRYSRLFSFVEVFMPIYFWVGLVIGLFSPLLSFLSVTLTDSIKPAVALFLAGPLLGWPLVIVGALVRWLG